MRRILSASVLAALLAASPAGAQEPKSPGELVDEIAQNLQQLLELFVRAVPQYAPPEILDNGDIIIRRIRPGERPAPDEEKNDGMEDTRT